MKYVDQLCRSMNQLLDCLSISDLVIEIGIIVFFAFPALYLTFYRICKMYKRSIYTIEQEQQRKHAKLLYWHLAVYLFTFCCSLGLAIIIYVLYQHSSHHDLNNDKIIQILGKVFWLSLYGYITLLNLIFTVIAYIFLAKSKDLLRKKGSKYQYWFFWICWIIQVLSFFFYIYLIFTNKQYHKPNNFQIVKYINLGQTIICTFVLIYIFCVVYRKVIKASIISFTVKKQQTKVIKWLVSLHFLRVIFQSLNIIFSDYLCKLRWKQQGKAGYFFAIYLGSAHIILNILPAICILIFIKPPKSQFHQSLITDAQTQ